MASGSLSHRPEEVSLAGARITVFHGRKDLQLKQCAGWVVDVCCVKAEGASQHLCAIMAKLDAIVEGASVGYESVFELIFVLGPSLSSWVAWMAPTWPRRMVGLPCPPPVPWSAGALVHQSAGPRVRWSAGPPVRPLRLWVN